MAKLKPLSTNLMYPLDLHRMDTGTHYMIFHIMSVADIKFEKNANLRVANVGSVVTDKAISGLQDVTKSAAASIRSAPLDISNISIKDSLGSAWDTVKSVGSSAFGVASDVVKYPYATADTIASALEKSVAGLQPTKKMNRLDTSIMLYIPQEGVHSTYTMNYQEEELGVTGALANNIGNGGSISGFIQSMGNAAPRAIAGGAAAGIDAIAQGGLPVNHIGTLEAVTRTTINPRKEQLFKGVINREFAYNHVFTPTTQKECDVVREIIQTFKLNMHPTLAYDGFYYNYPSEFEIEYHFGEENNKYVSGVSSCVLATLDIQYGQGSSWQTLRNGSPTHIIMKTVFKELQPLTRNLIEQEML